MQSGVLTACAYCQYTGRHRRTTTRPSAFQPFLVDNLQESTTHSRQKDQKDSRYAFPAGDPEPGESPGLRAGVRADARRSASAPTPRSSASSTACCCGRCRTRSRSHHAPAPAGGARRRREHELLVPEVADYRATVEDDRRVRGIRRLDVQRPATAAIRTAPPAASSRRTSSRFSACARCSDALLIARRPAEDGAAVVVLTHGYWQRSSVPIPGRSARRSTSPSRRR